MSVLYFITGLIFLIYGTILTRQLARGSGHRLKCCGHISSVSIPCRIQSSAIFIFGLFLAEALVWIFRIPEHSTYVALNSLNLGALSVILLLFWKSIINLEKDIVNEYNEEKVHKPRNLSKEIEIIVPGSSFTKHDTMDTEIPAMISSSMDSPETYGEL